MNVLDAIRLKRAVRKFQEKPLPEDVVKTILNAGRRSQSSKNEQTWQFIAIRDKSILKALSERGTRRCHPDSRPRREIPDHVRRGPGCRVHAACRLGTGSRLGPGFVVRA